VSTGERHFLVGHGLNVEADGGNGCYDFTQFQPVQHRGLASGVESNCDTATSKSVMTSALLIAYGCPAAVRTEQNAALRVAGEPPE
jgi:hypothetical protein